jgi:hypothetical protein
MATHPILRFEEQTDWPDYKEEGSFKPIGKVTIPTLVFFLIEVET